MNATEALAEAWASIDGKIEGFRRGKREKNERVCFGYYEGYIAEAQEMIKRLEARGYKVVPNERA